MIPGLAAEVERARAGDPTAAWSLHASPVAARWALEGGMKPSPSEPLPDAVTLRGLAARYGRIPASFVDASDGFVRAFCAAVRDDVALHRFASPILAAGLFALPRPERKAALLALPDVAQVATRRAFEVARTHGGPSESIAGAAQLALARASNLGGDARARVCAGLAALFFDRWSDELVVLSHGDWRGWRRHEIAPEVLADVAAWWRERLQ